MGKRNWSIAALTIVLVSGAVAQIALRPGRYEVVAEMQMGSLPAPTKFSSVDCITADEAENIVELMTKELAAAAEQGCTFSSPQTTGNKITLDFACEIDGTRMTGAGEYTFGQDSFNGVTTMRMPDGMTVTTRNSGKRVGECTGTEQDE